MNSSRGKLAPIGSLLLAATLPLSAAAAVVEFQLDEDAVQQLGLDTDSLGSSLGTALTDKFHLSDSGAFHLQMADALLVATKGMGVDYAPRFRLATMGVALGSGVSSGGFRFNKGGQEIPDFGYVFQAAFMYGMNLGVLTGGKSLLGRMRLYLDGFGIETTNGIMAYSIANVGAHLQFRLIEQRELGRVEWGGIDLTSGYEYAMYELYPIGSLFLSTEVEDITVTWEATSSTAGLYSWNTSVESIPVELSTSLDVLMASAFLGGAIDISPFAKSGFTAGLDGTLSASLGDQVQSLGTASVTGSGRFLSRALELRLFGGLELRVLRWAEVYGHLNIGLENSVGGHVGVRVRL